MTSFAGRLLICLVGVTGSWAGLTAFGSAETSQQSSDAIQVQVGSAEVTPDAGQAPPAGAVVFSFVQNGTRVTETGVPSARPTTAARIFAEIHGSRIKTGLAIANPNERPANVSVTLSSADGLRVIASTTLGVPARGQIAKFIPDLLRNVPEVFEGVLTIASDVAVAVVTLRLTINERDESVLSTLPVADLRAEVSSGAVCLPHMADGEGLTTQFVLLNPTSTSLKGRLVLFAQDGNPLAVTIGRSTASSFTYTVPGNGVVFAETAGSGGLKVGSVLIRPDPGNATPVPVGIFRLRRNGVLVTEAGVGAAPLVRSARIFVDFTRSSNTGIAVDNPFDESLLLNLTLKRSDGSSTGLTTTVRLPAAGQVAKFVDELFPGLALPFRGVLEVTSDIPFAAMTLRQSLNRRGEPLLTTLPVALSTPATSQGPMLFPHLVDGGGFQTEIILIGSGQAVQTGSLRLFDRDGRRLELTLGNSTGQSFPYQLVPGGGRRLASLGNPAVRVLETTNQLVRAAQGGTVALAGGSRVSIPAQAFKTDQNVTLTLLSSLPKQAPSGLITSVGPALSLAFEPTLSSPVSATLSTGGLFQQAASPGMEIRLDFSGSTADGYDGAVPLGQILAPTLPPDSNDLFLGVPGNVLVSGKAATVTLSPELMEHFEISGANSAATVYLALVKWAPSGSGGRLAGSAHALEWPTTPPVAAPSELKLWTKATGWAPLPVFFRSRGGRTCVMVHGVLSSVEKAFPAHDACLGSLAEKNGCDEVIGFNYEWTQDIRESGTQLAQALDRLWELGVRNVVLEAHSLGGVVALAAASRTRPDNGIRIERVVTLGSPIMGTPAASVAEHVATTSAWSTIFLPPVTALVASNFRLFVEHLSVKGDLTPGSSVLESVREDFKQTRPTTPVVVVGGSQSWFPKKISSWIFREVPDDGIIGLFSSLGVGFDPPAGITRLGPYNLMHTQLECDPRVVEEVGKKINPPGPPPAPIIALSTDVLRFSATEGGPDPSPQSLTVRNSGPPGSTLNYTILEEADWLGLDGPIRPLSSGDSERYTVLVTISGKTEGTYTATITVSDPLSTNRVQTVAVTLTIDAPSPLGSPPRVTLRFNRDNDRTLSTFADYADPDSDADSVEYAGSAYYIFNNPAGNRQSQTATDSRTIKLTNRASGSVGLGSFFISDAQIAEARAAQDTSITLVYTAKAQVTDSKGNKSGFVEQTETLTYAIQGNPVPVISSLNPSSATAGGSAFTLAVAGTNFVSGSVVRWNGQNRTTTFVSATQVNAAIPASDIAAAGTASVTVFNPAPGGGTSNALTFTISGGTKSILDGDWGGTFTVTPTQFCRGTYSWEGTFQVSGGSISGSWFDSYNRVR
ncbi:MAG: IPT/TIG domain-containing protein, partial [Acidobacteria bacterium]|nr:IPT/TIG domain-containing protein [Acidobacteriota bacterium]